MILNLKVLTNQPVKTEKIHPLIPPLTGVDVTDAQDLKEKPKVDIMKETLDIPVVDHEVADVEFISKNLNKRKSKPFQPIIMCFLLVMLLSSISLGAQINGSVKLEAVYSDNIFLLSDYDLQRYLDSNPELKFVNTTDDVIQKLNLTGAYTFHYRWWEIEPKIQILLNQDLLNTGKYGTDAIVGIQVKRLLGDVNLSYGYYPHTYLRNYIDTDGTGLSEKFSYAKNQYKADVELRPFKNSAFQVGYKLDEYFYNKFFSESDGKTNTWSLGYKHTFPVFYVNAGYDYKVFDTEKATTEISPEDSSYESNVYSFGLLLKKMPLDSKYPAVVWRPELKLNYEEKFYQGSDSFHKGRTDKIYQTDASLNFYFGQKWNLNLDYSHNFRNVDAVNSSVAKYKDFSENRFGLGAGYSF